MNSEMFDQLYAQNPSLRLMMRDKLVAVAGDLVMDRLGISEDVRAILKRDVDVIINVAASVKFDEPLLDAIQINYMGCMRMLELAKECEKLEVFTHVSTAYVNCNRRGDIEEVVYDLQGGEDPEEIIEQIIRMGPQRV